MGTEGAGRWVLPEVDPAGGPAAEASVDALITAFGLPPVLARLLVCRGIDTVEGAQRFLAPKLEDLHDPAWMLGMDRALERLRAGLRAGEPILVYGDYDVDGTVATVLLKTALERTAKAMGWPAADVRFHVPHRIREGYGIREARIAAAAGEGVRLVISVDTGIRAFAAAEECARQGLDLIVTDHHLPDAMGVPPAVAVLNPNQAGCPYPCKELCGAAVAFKLAQALLDGCCEAADDPQEARGRLREKTLPSFLKLLAIATIADAVPLMGENRTIAVLGLRELQRPAQAGLRALMELAGIDLARPVSAMDVGFRLGPRINAAGRMDVASDVVDLLLTRDEAAARALAAKLHGLNEDRRAVEAEALRAIDARLEMLAVEAAGLPACLVLDDEGLRIDGEGAERGRKWHRGVLGILASRVVERHGRPALVISHEDGEAHGSGRSVAGFHLLDALTAAHDNGWEGAQGLFSRFGGHAHAVGFALPSDRVRALRERMERIASEHAGRGETSEAGWACDATITIPELEQNFFAAYERLEPFGHGFPEPLFLLNSAMLAGEPRLLAGKHLRLSLRDPRTELRMDALAWSRRIDWPERARVEDWRVGMSLNAVVRLRRNWHPQYGGWELEMVEAEAV